MDRVVIKARLAISTMVLLAVLLSGCRSDGIVELNEKNSYQVIDQEIDALYDDLKEIERVYAKPLDQSIFDKLNDARKAVIKNDFEKSNMYYGQAVDLIKAHLVYETLIDEFRSALINIKSRYQYGGSCKEAWDQLMALVAEERLKRVIIPEFTLGPPATIIDAVDFIKQASRDYDDPSIPVEQRGVSLVLKMNAKEKSEVSEAEDPFAVPGDAGQSPDIPMLPRISARFINLYDALSMICDVAGYQFRLSRGLIMIFPVEDGLKPLSRDTGDAYQVIGEDLDALYDDLKTLERLYGKPLDQRIYDALSDAKQSVKNQDYMNLRELDGEIHHRVKEHLVDDSSLDTYRLALEKIGRRLDDDSPCQEAWGELRELRTKGILQRIIIPEVTFRPPDTLIDAVAFFMQASRDYGDPDIPVEQRGVSLCLKLNGNNSDAPDGGSDDPFGNNNAPALVIPALSARFISLYDALKLVCDVTGYKLNLRGGIVMLEQDNEHEEPVNGDCD